MSQLHITAYCVIQYFTPIIPEYSEIFNKVKVSHIECSCVHIYQYMSLWCVRLMNHKKNLL